MTPRAEIAMLTARIAKGKGRPGDAGRLAYLQRRIRQAVDMPGGVTGAEDNRAKAWRRYPKDDDAQD